MIVNIVAGSPFDLELLNMHPSDITIGVDYGAIRLLNMGIALDYAFGDFDSISLEDLNRLEKICKNINKYKIEKNNTDTELAFEFVLTLKPKVINLFGVTGKRLDHFLSTLFLFERIKNTECELYIYDEHNKIYLKKPGTYNIKKSTYKYISFFMYDKPVTLALKNFKYGLDNYLLKNQDSLCISNEITGDYGIISFTGGHLLIVESKD
ncbi:MAG: thiamine diphosphokinase [Bacilli bacterium]|nr:thiamine diphosphokinase [Bacilli bacterium]